MGVVMEIWCVMYKMLVNVVDCKKQQHSLLCYSHCCVDGMTQVREYKPLLYTLCLRPFHWRENVKPMQYYNQCLLTSVFMDIRKPKSVTVGLAVA